MAAKIPETGLPGSRKTRQIADVFRSQSGYFPAQIGQIEKNRRNKITIGPKRARHAKESQACCSNGTCGVSAPLSLLTRLYRFAQFIAAASGNFMTAVTGIAPRSFRRRACWLPFAPCARIARPWPRRCRAEDCAIQSMPDASPVKWHLAHTSWFFESLILGQDAGYAPFDSRFAYLFNSYYEALGPRHPRARRGLITRPALDQVMAYRRHVDAAMESLLARLEDEKLAGAHPAGPASRAAASGIDPHRHQACIFLQSAAARLWQAKRRRRARARAARMAGPSRRHCGRSAMTDRILPSTMKRRAMRRCCSPSASPPPPVSNGEYLAFIAGWRLSPRRILAQRWLGAGAGRRLGRAALLAERQRRQPQPVFTLAGVEPLDPHAPVEHVSFFEAAAFAAWAGKRLPTEFEWEAMAPRFAHGEVWEWTRSSYDPYPGFRPFDGAAAEYNGKFMVGQMVLRGGSVATPPGHARISYRNFFPPSARWQFSGIRLAEDA